MADKQGWERTAGSSGVGGRDYTGGTKYSFYRKFKANKKIWVEYNYQTKLYNVIEVTLVDKKTYQFEEKLIKSFKKATEAKKWVNKEYAETLI